MRIRKHCSNKNKNMKKQIDNSLLKFSSGKENAKLQQIGGVLYSFSLISGISCPFAKDCLTKAVLKDDGKYELKQGKDNQHNCFSASQEVLYPSVRKQREHNFNLLKGLRKANLMADLIEKSLPKNATIIRIHVGGDFFSKEYMKAWFLVAEKFPNIIFYAYTKSIGYWVSMLNEVPNNMKLNASLGGSQDNLIYENNLKKVFVVYTEQEAIDKNLEIDHDDTHAFMKNKDFALLIHGMQKKGTKANEARTKLQRENKGQYDRTKIKEQMKLAA